MEYREHLERLEKQKFAEVLKQYVEKDNELKRKKHLRRKYLAETTDAIKNNDFLSLKWKENARKSLLFGIGVNKQELSIEEQKVEKAREELLEYTKEKKIMEKLKERDYEKWREEKKKENKKIMNEISQHMHYLKQRKKDEENDTP